MAFPILIALTPQAMKPPPPTLCGLQIQLKITGKGHLKDLILFPWPLFVEISKDADFCWHLMTAAPVFRPVPCPVGFYHGFHSCLLTLGQL